ncbi:preprotein translocase subunit SecE [Blattabacterium cuenoti]|uniref:preprotein translocase subunit SecE n=1 Tax=Blattabacterium cuenoti TaxID=1653831 RepID=UPI00163C81FF|nr:preprotein translocase subunit SecE [Blattabacterium cuenoti]
MKKNNFFYEIYKEFFYYITWPKWYELQNSTILIIFCSVFLSIFLYGIDVFFIFLIKKFFSL